MGDWDVRAELLLIWLCGILGDSAALAVLVLVGVGYLAGWFSMAFIAAMIGNIWNRK